MTHLLVPFLRRAARLLPALLCAALLTHNLCAQTVIGGTTPNPSAALDIQSTDKGLLPPRMTTAQRNAIANPPTGLIIFNTTLNCIELNVGAPAAPDWRCLSAANSPSSNGTAVVSSYGGAGCTGSGSISGTMTAGTAVSGVTMTLFANVTQPGSWSLSAVQNGITFSGSGTFAGTGCQPVTLTASGTPAAAGVFTWAVNTTPSGSATATVNAAGPDPSSNGTAVVSAYACNTASAGTMTAGTAVSGVTQTITATVTTVGTYSITATANGITFSGSGTFAGTGSQTIVLTASGTPTAAGTNSFALSTTPGCSFDRTTISPGSISALNCAGATNSGSLYGGVAASGVSSSVPYTGGNGGAHSGQTVTSTGVTGLTATLAAGSFAGGAGSLTYTITGTPSGAGTASFALNIGGQTCTLTRTVQAIESLPAGSGSFTGETCFDIALSNDNTNNCAPLSSRTPRQANFTLTATNTQTYTFTPSGTVSNVRFVYSNTNGSVITNLTGGNSGNNITTAVTATVNYNTSLNTLALGLTNSNPLTATITVIYNDGATNNGTDRQFTLSVQVKDCACCGAATTTGGWLAFQCHNLGANTSVDPFTYSEGNADGSGGTLGHLYQWGRPADGHQLRNSATTTTLATSNTPGNSSFILNGTTSPFDWRSGGGNDARWGDGTQGANPAKAANDPCPPGWKVPSQSQWGSIYRGGTTSGTPAQATANTWTWTGNGYRVGSSLYLPAAGFRILTVGSLLEVGSAGYYWSSTVTFSFAYLFRFDSGILQPGSGDNRANGLSVRCVPQ